MSETIAAFLDNGGQVTFGRYRVEATWSSHEWEWSEGASYADHDDDIGRALLHLRHKMAQTIEEAHQEARRGNRVLIGDLVRISSPLMDRYGRHVPEGTTGTVQGGLMNFWPDLVPVMTSLGSILAPSECVDLIIDTTTHKAIAP